MHISFICNECGQTLTARTAAFTDDGVQFAVDLHVCEPTSKTCILADALDEIGEQIVHVSYWKKDGQYRSFRGFFPKKVLKPVGVVFFLESVCDGFAPKNLIRNGITEIEIEETGFTYIIG